MKGCRLPPVDPSTRALQVKNSPTKITPFSKKSRQHADQMPFFENTTILCRDPYDFDNYSTMKIEIAFVLNLERSITATATASWPRLLYCWNLQGGGHLCHSDLCFVVKSVPHQINVLRDFCQHIQKIF